MVEGQHGCKKIIIRTLLNGKGGRKSGVVNDDEEGPCTMGL